MRTASFKTVCFVSTHGLPHVLDTEARGSRGHELHQPLRPFGAPGAGVIRRFVGHDFPHELGIERIARGERGDKLIERHVAG